MTKISETIVFFGSGPVAASSLELLSKSFGVEAVVTKPKPAHHHGSFPVIDLAKSLDLPVYTVSDKTELSNLLASNPFSSSLGILIDFGIIVGQDVIDSFPLGIVNSHFSLLPQWRGADPITFSILSGQEKTGVSLMLIDAGMDTGKIIVRKSLSIGADATTESLTAKLIGLSSELLVEYIPKYLDGSVQSKSQPHPDRATYSRKLTKLDGRLEWSKPAIQLEREIRAFAGWPKSFASLGEADIIVTHARVEPATDSSHQKSPGTLAVSEKKEILVQTGDGVLAIDRLKPAGGKEMTSRAFLAGHPDII